jgi:16S rRNA G966 N2-methylase RsmD
MRSGQKREAVFDSSSPTKKPTPIERELIRSRDSLFCGIEANLRKNIQLDEVAAFSVTESHQADQMTLKIINYCQQNHLQHLRIFDGMACVGGNTISFAKSFQTVLSNEFSSLRYQMLVNNVQTVMQLHNVEFSNQSILDLAFTEIFEIIFLDPEWGGPDYKFKKNLRLTIGEVSVEDFCLAIFDRCPGVQVIALKLPVNYDNRYLRNTMQAKNIVHTFDNTFEKMTLTLLRRGPVTVVPASLPVPPSGSVSGEAETLPSSVATGKAPLEGQALEHNATDDK